MGLPYAELSAEQRFFVDKVFERNNVLVDACIGSGKTTAIQTLCDLLPDYLNILYLTYNRLLKVDARQKIQNHNVTVTNYHGFVYPYLNKANIRCGVSESIAKFNQAKLPIPKFDVIIIDEYQDIELDFAEMLEYVKSTNPDMQIIFVGDMAQKIYDKTTLKVEEWAKTFMGERLELEFTQCFRLSDEHARKLGRVWGKTIKGVNPDCKVREMDIKNVNDYIANQYPGDVICLGSKTGKMAKTLNYLEKYHNDKFNKNTVYASIQEKGANINPDSTTAIFTTFDSAKGMEKPVCVVFDWDEHYWNLRNEQADANYDILKNIFCVAASRGKNEIIFVKADSPRLTERVFSKRLKSKSLTQCYIPNMFDFKFTEEIGKCMEFLNIRKIDHNNSCELIELDDSDGLIDLTPCINVYQASSYFKNYNLTQTLNEAFERQGFTPEKLSELSDDARILRLIALETRQNRYKYQVKLPFINAAQRNEIHERLSEQLSPDDDSQVHCQMNLEGITVHGRCDAIRDNTVWELKFARELKREHFLSLAMYLVAKPRKNINEVGRLWNTRDNRIFEVSVKQGKETEFLKQVARTIRKDTHTSTTRTLSPSQLEAINRYRKPTSM